MLTDLCPARSRDRRTRKIYQPKAHRISMMPNRGGWSEAVRAPRGAAEPRDCHEQLIFGPRCLVPVRAVVSHEIDVPGPRRPSTPRAPSPCAPACPIRAHPHRPGSRAQPHSRPRPVEEPGARPAPPQLAPPLHAILIPTKLVSMGSSGGSVREEGKLSRASEVLRPKHSRTDWLAGHESRPSIQYKAGSIPE